MIATRKSMGKWGALALLATLGLGVRADAALPSDLDAVPRDAAAFVHVRAADVWKNEALADLRRYVKKAGAETLKQFEDMFTPNPADVERVTFVMLTSQSMGSPIPYRVDPENRSALVIVSMRKPYDRLDLIKAIGFREKFYQRHLYYFNEEMWSGLVLIDDKTFLFGSEDSVIEYFNRSGRKTGPMQSALEEAAKPHLAVLGWGPRSVAELGTLQFVPPNIKPLFEADCMVASFDIKERMELNLRFEFAKKDAAAEGAKALRATLDLGRAGLGMGINELETEFQRNKENVEITDLPAKFGLLVALGFMRDLDDLMKNAKIEQVGSTVRVPFDYQKLTPAQNAVAMMMMGSFAFLGVRSSATFNTVGEEIGGKGNPNEDHLRKLAEAMEKYHADKKHYPPPAMLDKDGRPVLSWRVALLPYMDQQDLYNQFRLDEPWDSLHNKKLIQKMPRTLKGTEPWGKRLKTVDFIVTGPDAAFQDLKKGPKRGDVNNKSVFLMFTEAGDPGVYWTKPMDLRYEANKPLPKIWGRYGRRIHVLLKDGTYKALQPNSDAELKKLIEGKQD